MSKNKTASEYLLELHDVLETRAKERDRVNGERSIEACVDAFNAIYSANLTYEQGWSFMLLLKLARSAGGKYREDDFIDAIGYAALLAEQAYKDSTL